MAKTDESEEEWYLVARSGKKEWRSVAVQVRERIFSKRSVGGG